MGLVGRRSIPGRIFEAPFIVNLDRLKGEPTGELRKNGRKVDGEKLIVIEILSVVTMLGRILGDQNIDPVAQIQRFSPLSAELNDSRYPPTEPGSHAEVETHPEELGLWKVI